MIRVCGPRDKAPGYARVVDVTTRSKDFGRRLSPMLLGPVNLPGGTSSLNVENAWQYSKVYPIHADGDGNPTENYFKWARQGFNKKWADRYPMGKGARPLYSWWRGKKLGYIDARKEIYMPLYINAVARSDAWTQLVELFFQMEDLWLWDFDGYDHVKHGMTLTEVAECSTRKMGHGFVLAMLLQHLLQGE